jgi:hypothetical protein
MPRSPSRNRFLAGRARRRWSLRSGADVRQFWNAFSKVPPRLKREHLDEELYCLALYLRALSRARLLKYPVSIKAAENSKSPDFILTSRGNTIGIEVTRATTPEFQRSMTNHEKHFERTGKTTATLLSANGWAGNDAEEQWCRLIQETINRKERLLGKYEPAKQHELLIYDDAPLPTIDRSFVIPRVKSWSRSRSGGTSFATVSVILSLDVIHDLRHSARVIPFVTRSSGALQILPGSKSDSEKPLSWLQTRPSSSACRPTLQFTR